MRLAGAECGRRPNSTAASDGVGGGAWQAETGIAYRVKASVPVAGSDVAHSRRRGGGDAPPLD